MSELLVDNRYVAIIWTFGALATTTTCGRLYIHWRYSGFSRPDNILNGLACLTLIAYLALTQVSFVEPTFSTVSNEVLAAMNMLIWITLYLVKASFLSLYWILFNPSPKFRIAWWLVTIYTFLTFWPIFLSFLWKCGPSLKYTDPQTCMDALNNGTMIQWMISVGAIALALHVSSECLILGMPLAMIGRLQLATDKKIGIAAVFVLTIIDIVFGIIRNVSNLAAGLGESSEALVYISDVFEIAEPCCAVIICAMPAYRVLLPSTSRRQTEEMTFVPGAAEMGEGTLRKSGSIQTWERGARSIEERETMSVF